MIWDSITRDKWIHPYGNEIGKLFDKVFQACPDFYIFGIHTDAIQTMLETSSDNGFFLGELHEKNIDLLLPDRPGFLYYSKALEDLPVIFYTRASASVSLD